MQNEAENPSEAQRRVLDERQLERERELGRYRVLAIMTALAASAFLLFVASFLYEGNRLHREIGRPPERVDHTPPATRTIEMPVEALYMLFPPEIRGYATKAAHNVPYADGIEAEALYEPADMDLQTASPMTVYCRLTAWDSEEDARRAIEDASREFPVESARTTIGDGATVVTVGYDERRGRYFVGYYHGAFSLEVHALYTVHVPVVPRDTLRSHAEKVAAEVIRAMSQGLSNGD